METRASYVAVGGFVLALVAGLVVFVVWLGKFQGQQQFAYYDILFAGSVTGLQVDGPVRYRGIPVGHVADIRIDPSNIEMVRVTIQVRRGTPVRRDTVASLEMQGVTGVSYVLLSGGMQESEPLPETSKQPYPMVASKPSRLEELFQGAPDLLNKLSRLVDRVDQLVSDENRQAFGQILVNLQELTGAFAEGSGGLSQLLTNGAAAVDQIRSMSAEFQSLAQGLEALAKDTRTQVSKVGGESDATIRDLRATAKTFAAAAQQIEALIKENRGPLHDFTSTGAYELTQLFTEIRLLVASLSRVSAQIERDPARFLFGDRQKGFKAE